MDPGLRPGNQESARGAALTALLRSLGYGPCSRSGRDPSVLGGMQREVREAGARGLTAGEFRRFPQLDAIAFRVHDPGEAAVIGVFTLGIDPYSRLAKRA